MKVPRPRRYYIPLLIMLCSPALLQAASRSSSTSQTTTSSSANKQHRKSKKIVARHSERSSTPSFQKSLFAKKKKSTSQSRHKVAQPAAARKLIRPTPERYAEIQTALTKAGYFQGPANGEWGKSSATALAKFQEDNGLEPTGKFDAQTLIKLDLGPKHDDSTASVSAGADPSN